MILSFYNDTFILFLPIYDDILVIMVTYISNEIEFQSFIFSLYIGTNNCIERIDWR